MPFKLKSAYILFLFFISIIVFVIVDHFLSNEIKLLTQDKYLHTSKNLNEQLQETIKNKTFATLNIALSLSENSGYKNFLKNKKVFDIDLKKVSLKLKEHSNFENVWIHLIDKNGISRYRSWSPKKDDNISAVRSELPALLKNPKVSSVISVGIFDMTFKSIVPIYDNGDFLGLIEVITKMNSIAKGFEKRGIDLVILVDKKFKNQIKKPFTKDFLDEYYVANVNAKKELKEIIKKDINEYITIKEYKIIKNYFVSLYTLKDFNNQNMAYFIMFKDINSINLNDIKEFEYFIKFIGILLVLTLITIFTTIYFYNKAKYTTTLEHDVKKRTKELNDLTKKYHQIFEGSKTIKLIIDPKTKNIIDVNNSATKFYGYSKEHFLKLKADDLNIVNKDVLNSFFEKILSNTQNIFIFKHKLSNGEIKDVEVYASPINIDTKTYIYSIIRDITEDLKAKKELEKKQKLFYQQAKMASMGEMLENIAHQWRQPLSTITTAASGAKIKKEFGELDDEFFYDSIDIIIRAANYLSHTIDDFRDFFKQSKKKEEFDLSNVLNNSIKLAHLKKTNIELIITCPHIKITGFKNELIQVLLNIFNNSKDALNNIKNAQKLIKIDIKEIDGFIIISILDNGGGIAEDKIDKIFEPYFTTKHKSQGTGIGLYMSEQIITKHFQGEINVQNENFSHNEKKHFGTKIKIKIPNKSNS